MTVPYRDARPRRWYYPLIIVILGLVVTGLLAVFLGLRTLERVIPLPVVYDPRAQQAPFFLRPAEPSQLLTASFERASRRPPAGTRLVGRFFWELAWERLPPESDQIAAVEA